MEKVEYPPLRQVHAVILFPFPYFYGGWLKKQWHTSFSNDNKTDNLILHLSKLNGLFFTFLSIWKFFNTQNVSKQGKEMLISQDTFQEEIHELLLSFAEAGATVVRLKGGDPLVVYSFTPFWFILLTRLSNVSLMKCRVFCIVRGLTQLLRVKCWITRCLVEVERRWTSYNDKEWR